MKGREEEKKGREEREEGKKGGRKEGKKGGVHAVNQCSLNLGKKSGLATTKDFKPSNPPETLPPPPLKLSAHSCPAPSPPPPSECVLYCTVYNIPEPKCGTHFYGSAKFSRRQS